MEQKCELSITSEALHSNEIDNKPMFDFGNLPADIKLEIGLYLAPTIKNILALTSLKHFSLFKPNKSELINKLLVCVAWGQQGDVEKLLKISPELMLEKTTFTDCSGRTFLNISAFEFVLWALDTRYMVNMMFNCLPKNEIGLNLATKLEKQYYHHRENGVTYNLDGQLIKEKHFNFSILINALQTYVENYDNWTGPQCEAHWCKVVGMAQSYMPAHVMQHYCEPNVPFYPLPKFEAEQFIRTLEFYSYHNDQDMTWAGTSSDSVLGKSLGIIRSAGMCLGDGYLMRTLTRMAVRNDSVAVVALSEVRISDYLAVPTKLASLFEKKATEDETPNNRMIS